MNHNFHQPYSVVNYPSKDIPYTRCVEYKHFLNQNSNHTVYVKETTTDIGEPYYPVLNDKNKELYKKYQKMAENESKNIHFIGRLASYKYFNMDQAIKNSLDYFKEHFNYNLNSKTFYFYIRGHIRDAFKTNKLKNFIKLLKKFFPNIIFILQTWKNIECNNNESWKEINYENKNITKSLIDNYFEDINITNNLIIIDEKTIQLNGEINGKVLSSKAPLKGWKNMWYGIYKGIEKYNNINNNNILISFRYDYFNIIQSYNINEYDIIQFINNNLNTKTIKFIKDKNDLQGCDNLYMGPFNLMKKLVYNFNYNLDNIINQLKTYNILNQEVIVYIVAHNL